MADSLTQIIYLVQHNHLVLDKTDEIDLFFGKIGNNKIVDKDRPTEIYHYWMHKVMTHSNCFHSRFFEENNIFCFNKLALEQTITEDYLSVSHLHSLQDYAADQTQKHGIKYMLDIMPVMHVTYALQRGDLTECINQIKLISQTFLSAPVNMRIPMQTYGMSLTLLTEYLLLNLSSTRYQYVPTLKNVLHAIARSAVNLDKKSPINCISQHSKIFNLAFTRVKRQAGFLRNALAAFNASNELELLRILAVICFCHGNIEQGCKLLSRSCGQLSSAQMPCDLLLFQIQLLSSTLKQMTSVYSEQKVKLKDFDINKVNDINLLICTTERLNLLHTLKFGYKMLNQTFNDLIRLMANSRCLGQLIWSCSDLMHPGLSNVLKEEIILKAIKAIRNIIKIRQQKLHQYKSKKVSKGFSTLDKFPATKQFLEQFIPNIAITIDFALSDQEQLQMRFCQQFEVVLACLFEQYETNDTTLIPAICQITLPKLSKVIHYLRVMSSVKYLDRQVNQLSSKLKDSCQEDQRGMKVEIDFKLVLSLKSFLALINIESLVQAQQYINRNLHVLEYLLTHQDSTVLDNPNAHLFEALRKLSFSRLNQDNKRIVKELFVKIKVMSKDKEERYEKVLEILQSQIENDDNLTIEKILDDFSEGEKKKLLKRIPAEKLKEKGQENFDKELWRVTQDQIREELELVLKTMDVTSLFEDAKKRANMIKATFFATYAHARSLVGLPMNTSLFYRGSCFEKRECNIFGLTKEDIEPFEEQQDQSLEDILQKTCLKLDQTVIQVNHEQEKELRSFLADQKEERTDISSKDYSVFRKQFIQNYKRFTDQQTEHQYPQGQVSERFFESKLPQTTNKPFVLDLQKVSKLSKVTLRKNSTRRLVTMNPIDQPIKKPRPKGALLPPKPLKVTKFTEKSKQLERLAQIATKDVREAITRWKQLLPKIGNDQRFNLIILQPGKNKPYLMKDPRKLYGDARLGKAEIKATKKHRDQQAFDLVSVKPIEAQNAVQEAEQKLLGQKVKVVSRLEKTPVQLPVKSKVQLLMKIMKKMEDVGAQVVRLQQDFERQQRPLE